MQKITVPSEHDYIALKTIRSNVTLHIKAAAQIHDRRSNLVLDIAPQIYKGAKSEFHHATVQSLDIDPSAQATYTADLTKCNRSIIPDNHFDVIICTEVLEHTLNPFSAVKELHRIVKSGGFIYISTPFNFRIHGPLPDCWRFTEHGLRVLFKQFTQIKIEPIENDRRPLCPIQYLSTIIK